MKKPILVVTGIILLAAIVGGFMLWQKDDKQSATTLTEQVTQQPDAPATPENDKDIEVKQQDDSDTPPEKTSPQNESDDTSSNTDATVSITAAGFSNTSQKAYVRTMVEGAKTGSCTARFTKAGKPTISVTSQVTPVTSYYDCGKLEVARSKFSATGTWTVQVTLTTGGSSVVSANEKITIK